MLTHPTLDQLRALKLDGMADAFLELEQQDAARDLTRAEWLALLLDREIANRTSKRTQIRLRAARLRYSQASVEDVNYRAQRHLDKALFQQLATCRWIAEKRNLLVGGKCGLGKTWLACALAQRACREGYRAYYARMPRLFAQLELAHGDGSFHRLFRLLTKVDLLILDLGEVQSYVEYAVEVGDFRALRSSLLNINEEAKPSVALPSTNGGHDAQTIISERSLAVCRVALR